MLEKRKHFLLRVLDPALFLAIVCTLAFYAFVHQPAMHGTALHRYTTEHVVEYVIVALFIWGICDILVKFLSFPREALAVRLEWVPPRQGREPAANADALLQDIRTRHR